MPHSTMSRLAAMSSGRMPMGVPSVAATPALAVSPHTVRSRRLAPSRAKKRRSIPAYCTSPMFPA